MSSSAGGAPMIKAKSSIARHSVNPISDQIGHHQDSEQNVTSEITS